MKRVSVYTLGCKLNQVEGESIAAAFRKAGWETGGEGTPDLCVFNTCTVTSKAEQKARRVIRLALRRYPRCRVCVTGCYANMERDALLRLAAEEGAAERFSVVTRKAALLDWARGTGEEGAERAGAGGSLSLEAFRFVPAFPGFHARPFLKVQDGCDRRCAYCRVALARGPAQSLGAQEALERLRALEKAGAAEAVLTGVNLGAYREPEQGFGLGGLVEALLAGTERIALRLSSLEVDALNAELGASLASPRVRPHFHLSVQSGSAAVLSRMGRPYTGEAVEKAVRLLRAIKGDPFLACDIICGFPGESESEAQETFALCERMDFAWIHAFPYSRRPGTAAASFSGAVPERLSRERVEALLALARSGKKAYTGRWLGKTVEAVGETVEADGTVVALTENYLRLRLRLPPPLPGRGAAFRCRIERDCLAQESSDGAAGGDFMRGVPGGGGRNRFPPAD